MSYVFGGLNGTGYQQRNAYRYDHISEEWDEIPNMSHKRAPVGCGLVQTREDGPEIVIVGNRNSDYNTQVEIHNPQRSNGFQP